MKTTNFDYHLPADRIAQRPAEPRDHARLIILDRATGSMEHRVFYELNDFLRTGDLLVVNESKVFKARLRGKIEKGSLRVGRDDKASSVIPNDEPGEESRNRFPTIEIFLLRPQGEAWIALAKPGKKICEGDVIYFDNDHQATVLAKQQDGTVHLCFYRGILRRPLTPQNDKREPMTTEDVLTWSDSVGEVPLPPYIDARDTTEEDYQTVYAKHVGSVAAPTAGFHFTPALIEKLKHQGIQFASLTLHVGLGTFRPVKTDTLEEHVMHEEWIDVPEKTLRAIEETHHRGGRVIAVGTTTVRALESDMHHGLTNIFIKPGYHFKKIDGLITNFHLPKSTLLVLVSAFMGEKKDDPDEGRQMMLRAYKEAIEKGYRFYSFGDAMFIS